MKIYFDESGQTGCVLRKEDLLNFQTQPVFALGAIVLTDKEEKKFVKKYRDFKKKYNIEGELKGSDLLTRRMNAPLEYFVNHFLDNRHFYVILYNKRFYLSTLLLSGLMGRIYQQCAPVEFYQQASALSFQDDEFFLKYLEYIEKPTVERFEEYLQYLVNFKYQLFSKETNAAVAMAERILSEHDADKFFDDFMTFGWYENPKQTNVINLNALSELIYQLKLAYKLENRDAVFTHDNIIEFEETFSKELETYDIEIEFADSKSNECLQIIDNVVSVVRGTYDRMLYHIRQKDEWSDAASWDMKMFSKVFGKLTTERINFTTPMCDWSAALTFMRLFSAGYAKKDRNYRMFNNYYLANLEGIEKSIQQAMKSDEEVTSIMKL